jgi:hypothetical protein
MDNESKIILKNVGLVFETLHELNGALIPREHLLSDNSYDEIKKLIPDLKKNYSSSLMTSLQKTAEKNQRWPLLNLIRQILNNYNYKMEPVRKADGYTLDGIKKYKRFFLIREKSKDKDNLENVCIEL